jgi:hypothetical protein
MKNRILVLLICLALIFTQGCSTLRYIKEHHYKSFGYVAGATLIACAVVAQAYSQSYQSQPSYYQTYIPTYSPQTAVVVPQYTNSRGGHYTLNSIGNLDYVSGSNGYHGSGHQIGNFYYYNDNQGDRYTMQRIGNLDYISGSDGYHGTGQRIGNFYYYNDNE